MTSMISSRRRRGSWLRSWWTRPRSGRPSSAESSSTAPSLDLLLYDWLSELIYVKDSEQLVFPVVEARVSAGSPCRLSARLVGGPIDRTTTALRADPKAVTFHQFALEPREHGWRARVVIDI